MDINAVEDETGDALLVIGIEACAGFLCVTPISAGTGEYENMSQYAYATRNISTWYT
jgi:hypothetical protein